MYPNATPQLPQNHQPPIQSGNQITKSPNPHPQHERIKKTKKQTSLHAYAPALAHPLSIPIRPTCSTPDMNITPLPSQHPETHKPYPGYTPPNPCPPSYLSGPYATKEPSRKNKNKNKNKNSEHDPAEISSVGRGLPRTASAHTTWNHGWVLDHQVDSRH
ncbi:hypothetical protein BO71DRAFT_142955 [Aspergillus ellipticus CBS 707.79]|uniref:Uncharacterized protein n=1 Tax=Aspergillus ellipticus CBS 707.79 TaxID=1448320 RepID=A0A319DI85_9EURO|nr:hypothetical protein BO71DRAFT_142955 [Aspergillus ellipticus CBS 707.79]